MMWIRRFSIWGLICLSPLAVLAQDDLHTQMMRATVKLNNEKSCATGFVLYQAAGDKSILVTAAHVLEETAGDETTIVFRSQDLSGEYHKLPHKVLVRQGGKPSWVKHPTEDLAALWIVPPATADLPKIPLELLATDDLLKLQKIHPGEQASFVGYPHRLEANGAGFAVLRTGAIASFPLLPTAKNKTFLLSANVFEGDSGSPVYWTQPSRATVATPDAAGGKVESASLILGLVSAQHFLDEELKSVYTSSKTRHRMGLAIVVQAPLIRETIELLR